jgi:outer membrane protein assembly factor BamE (lipoprotein component of BamABCDE complex)
MRGAGKMKRGYRVAVALVLTTALAACMKDEEPEDAIPEGYKKSMEKAEQVEQKMQDAAEQRMQGLEDDG